MRICQTDRHDREYLAAAPMLTLTAQKLLLNHRNQPESAFQTSVTLVKCSHHGAAVQTPSVRRVQMKGCGWRPDQAAQWPREARWELGVAAAKFPWYSPNELHCCSQHEPSLLHTHTHTERVREPCTQTHTQPVTAAAGARTSHTHAAETCTF